MFLDLFYNVLSVFLMMLPGFLLIRANLIKETTLKDFSQVTVTIFYPLLIFSFIVKNFTIETLLSSWKLPVSVLILTLLGYAIGKIYLMVVKCKNKEMAKSQLFQFTFNNYSFFPLAIVANLYDDQHVAALLLSTLGAELSIWTIGMTILRSNGQGFSLSSLKHLLAPPMIGIYAALVVVVLMHLFHTSVDEINSSVRFMKYLQSTLFKLGQATIPLSMLMVGGRIGKIQFVTLKSKSVWITTFFRLIVIPFISVLVLLQLFPGIPYINVILIVAVMPNAAASLLLGELYGADQNFMGGTVMVTHLVSLLTIPLWLQIFTTYF